ncbi:hypothetical protein ACFL06_02105, partial [Patescibacteria group bacterium]
WRDERKKPYEIQLSMPWGKTYTLRTYKTSKGAFRAYLKMVRQLKEGTARIEIGARIKIVPIE